MEPTKLAVSDETWESIALDAVDYLAPVRKPWQQAWQRSLQAAQQHRWDRAVQQLAPVIGRPDGEGTEDAMVRHPDGTLRSARLEAARLLLRLPARLREQRARRLNATGMAVLPQAVSQGDLPELERIAVHFAGTGIGDEAVRQLVAALVDRGHFGLAAAWVSVWNESGRPVTETEDWRRQSDLIDAVLARTMHRRPGRRESDADTGNRELSQLARGLIPEEPETVSDWPMIGGNPRRHAVAPSQTPTLVPRWSALSTSDASLVSRIDRMIDDLRIGGRSSVPVAAPLFVGSRMAVRTLRGIEVRDVASGRLLWTAGQRRSLETLLSGEDSRQRRFSVDPPDGGDFVLKELSADSGPGDSTAGGLGQALFQNALYGFLSSDGERLFGVSDDPVYSLGRTSVRNRNGQDFSPEPGSASANRLEAFDLSSGHLQWRRGGPLTEEAAGPAMAGWFFLGAPLVTHDGLFVIAQNAESVRLFCLDAESGRVRWSQMIGWSDNRLDRDLNRRLSAALPSLAHGVVVCPTGLGWVIGADSLTGTLLWAHRIPERLPESGNGTPGLFLRNRGLLEVANRRVDSHWVASPPVIAGASVLLTPAETKDGNDPSTGILVCLDLFTGRKQWELPRREATQLVTVTEETAVLAGPRTIEALTLDGRDAWKFRLPDESAQISGRVLAMQGSLLVPTQSGIVLAVDAHTGTLQHQWSLVGRRRPLASLYASNGLLISVHPAELAACEMQSTLEQKLRPNSGADSSGQQILQRAQLALSRGHFREARRVLGGYSPDPNGPSAGSFEAAVLRTAVELRKTSPEEALQFLQETPLLSPSGGQSVRQVLLMAELHDQAGRRADAFEQLCTLVRKPKSVLETREDAPQAAVAVMHRVHAGLHDLWTRMTGRERQRADTLVKNLFADAGLSDEVADVTANTSDAGAQVPVNTAGHLGVMFGFHAQGQAVLRRLARRATERGDVAAATQWWSEIRAAETDPVRRFEADLQILVHEFQFLHPRERERQLSVAALRIESLNAGLGSPLPELLETLAAVHREQTERQQRAEGKGRDGRSDSMGPDADLRAELRRLPGSEFESTVTGITDVTGQPVAGPRFSVSLESHSFEADRLRVVDRTTDGHAWSLPLESHAGPGGTPVVRRVGTVLVTLLHGRLMCLSPLDRRILWTRTLDGNVPGGPSRSGRTYRLSRAADWVTEPGEPEPLQVASRDGRYLCCRTERRVTVLETRTGAICWMLTGLRERQKIVCAGAHLFVLRSRGQVEAGYRLTDGRPVPDEELPDVPVRELRRDVWGHVTVHSEDDSVVVRRVEQDATRWEYRFPLAADVCVVGDETLAVMQARGHFETLDLLTGTLDRYPRIPAEHRVRRSRVTLLPGADRWLLLLQGNQVETPGTGGLEAVSVQGTLVSFDRSQPARQPWYSDVGDFALPLDELPRLPVLILLRETGSPLVPLARTRHLTLLDRRTGRPLKDSAGRPFNDRTMPGTASFADIAVSDDGQLIELRSGTERLRLILTGQLAEE